VSGLVPVRVIFDVSMTVAVSPCRVSVMRACVLSGFVV
jgi:hypothetical protein